MLCTDGPEKWPFSMNNNIVDVRDVAELHVRAMEVPEAGGERFIASSRMLFNRFLGDASKLTRFVK